MLQLTRELNIYLSQIIGHIQRSQRNWAYKSHLIDSPAQTKKKYKQGAFLNVHLLFLVSNQSSSDEDIDDEKDEDDEVTDRDLR